MRLVDKMRSAPVPAVVGPRAQGNLRSRARRGARAAQEAWARCGARRDERLRGSRHPPRSTRRSRARPPLEALWRPPHRRARRAARCRRVAPSTATPTDAAITNVPFVWLDQDDLGLSHDPRTLARGVTRGIRERFRRLARGSPTTFARPMHARASTWGASTGGASTSSKPRTRPRQREPGGSPRARARSRAGAEAPTGPRR